jgi:hypothetical protein
MRVGDDPLSCDWQLSSCCGVQGCRCAYGAHIHGCDMMWDDPLSSFPHGLPDAPSEPGGGILSSCAIRIDNLSFVHLVDRMTMSG